MKESVSAAFAGRKLWVDALRGMAMFFVVMVHAVARKLDDWQFFYIFTSPLMIPLFFAISGYVFSDKRISHAAFFKGIFFRLVVPMVVLSLLPVSFILSFSRGWRYFARACYNLASGVTAWYIPCCIVAEILHFYVRRLCKRPAAVALVSVLLCSAGFVMARLNVMNFAMINRAFIAQAYLLIGYLFRKYEEKFSALKPACIAVGGALYMIMTVVSLILYPGQYMDIHLNQYYNIPLCMAMILVGCFTAFMLAGRIRRMPRALVYLGQNTFVCYMLHNMVFMLWAKLFSMMNVAPPSGWIAAAAKACFACIVCCIIAAFINRFIPEAAGKRRKSRRSAE